MAYYDALVAKWGTLSGTTAQKLTAINAATVSVPLPPLPMIIPSHQIYECIDTTEFGALSAANQTLVRDLLNMGTVDARLGSKARARILALFGSATATRANLTALAATYETRSETRPWWSTSVAEGGGGLTSTVTDPDLVAAGGLS
jgi:hypothetical protein